MYLVSPTAIAVVNKCNDYESHFPEIASRPLPGVPGQERKNWPLPPPPGQPNPSGTAVVYSNTVSIPTPVPDDDDEQQANYELATAPPDEDSPEPGPYEVAVSINYEDININDEPQELEMQPQDYEVPRQLTIPSLHDDQPLPPVPPPRRSRFITTSCKSVYSKSVHT